MWAKTNLKVLRRNTLLAALAAALVPCAGVAQAVSDWQLPDPSRTSAPRVQGPVDPDNPVIQPRPTITPSSPAPTVRPSSVPTIAPQPAPSRPAARPATPSPTPSSSPSRPAATASPQPAATTPADPAATPSPPPLATSDAPDLAPLPAETVASAAAPPPANGSAWPIWVWALPVALLIVATGAIVWFRRRDRREEVPEFVPTPLRSAAAEPSPPASVPPIAAKTPANRVDPLAPQPTADVSEPLTALIASGVPGLELTLEPALLRISLVYATLQYRFAFVNTATSPTQPLTIRGDLISAHASLGNRAQLAPDPAQLDALHAVPPLAPGERMALKGELRLPLSAILPIRQGEALYMAPLLRLLVTGDNGTFARSVFHLGLAGTTGSQVSIRIDNTTGDYAALCIREIEAARLPRPTPAAEPLPLDPLRAAS